MWTSLNRHNIKKGRDDVTTNEDDVDKKYERKKRYFPYVKKEEQPDMSLGVVV